MQGYHLYEYAIIRLVPRVERGEFVNVGTMLYCSGQRFLACTFHWDEPRILALFPETDMHLVRQYALSFELICTGQEEGGPIAKLSLPERFRWLAATRSTMLQASPVHTGYTQDAATTLLKLHQQQVC